MAFYKTGGSDELWKAMAGVSQQGKKRGRAKNTMKKKDLNRGRPWLECPNRGKRGAEPRTR